MKQLLILLLLLHTCSCHTKKQETNGQNRTTSEQHEKKNEITKIDPRDFDEGGLNLGAIASDIKYIPLSNKFPIGYIKSIKVSAKSIYIISDESSTIAEGNGKQILFKYNKAGKNPIQIGAIGKGASEYLTCSYFAVLEAKDRVYINGKPNTVLVYNTNGEFIRSFRFKNSSLRFNQMEIFDNGHLFLAQKGVGSNIEHLWSISDTLGNIVSQKKNTLPTFQTNIGSKGGVFQSGEGFSYWIDHNDTIFSISPNFSFRPSYVFTPGEHRWSNKNVNVYSLKEHIEKRKKFYTPHFFIETQKYLISQYAFKEKNSYVFLNKETHKTLTCDFNWETTIREGIPNNFDNGIMFNVESYFNQGQSEFLIGVIFPYQLKLHVASDAFKNSTPLYPEKKKELEKLANSLDQNDNPVLMLLELKQ